MDSEQKTVASQQASLPQALHAALQHHQFGSLAEAEVIYRQLLAVDPENADVLHMLGVLAHQAGHSGKAVELIIRAVNKTPTYWVAHNNLGEAYRGLKRFAEAEQCYRRTVAINPAFAMAYCNLGSTLLELCRPEEAEQACRQALAIQPDYTDAHYTLGLALQSQNRLDDAVASYRNACAFKPDFTPAYYNMGIILLGQGKLEEAEICYRNVVELCSGSDMAHGTLISLYLFRGKFDEAFALATKLETVVLSDAERTAACSRKFNYSSRIGRKLRIGVVSAEIGQHAVADFLEPVLEQLDRNRCHLVLFATKARSESRTARFHSLADKSISLVELSDSMAAELILSERIDILIDTTGHTNGGRLGIFAHRAAPVQCHYIGYYGTTGLTEMDWFIGDDILLPSSCDAHFREGIWRLPRLWISYKGNASLPESHWAPSNDGAVWLGSFNNFGKVQEKTLHLWAQVMNALPESKLFLKDQRTNDQGIRHRIITELSRYGITGERIEFAAFSPDWHTHMALYDRVDIALDTIPLNSGTSAFDALWMGVPLVAMEGDWMGGRMTTSILAALGKPEWIARTEEEYVETVCKLAHDVEGRTKLRRAQRSLMAQSPLCDAQGMARALEDAFEAMFDQWEAARGTSRMDTHDLKYDVV